jgi:hypothetical protein
LKKIYLPLFSVIAFLFVAAPIFARIFVKSEVHPLLLNGKPFSKAFLINGVWVLPTEDVIKGAGEISAEPSFKFQGTSLLATVATGEHFKKVEPFVQKVQGASENKIKPAGRQLLRVNRAGVISSHVFMYEGKTYFPVADFVKAFNGGVFNPGTQNLGESINLNFAVNGDGILGVQQ